MKKLALLMTALMLTGCNAGGGSSDPTQQNFIYDSQSKLITGSVILGLATKESVDQAWSDFEKSLPSTTTVEQKAAYKNDIIRTASTTLATIVYDKEKTGSYTWSFDMKQVFGNYFDIYGRYLDDNKLYLNLYFSPTGNKYRNAYVSGSDFNIECQYTYTDPGHDPVEKTSTLLSNKSLNNDTNFYNNIVLSKYNLSVIKNLNDELEYISNAKLVFSSSLKVIISDK